jgi:hypothetical protein
MPNAAIAPIPISPPRTLAYRNAYRARFHAYHTMAMRGDKCMHVVAYYQRRM